MAEETFPFGDLTDEEFIYLFICETSEIDAYVDLNNFEVEKLNSMTFNQFPIHQECRYDQNDPNRFIRNNLNTLNPICKYYMPDELETKLMDFQTSNLKITCHNINSLPIKFDNYVEELSIFFKKEFDFIGFCETKLTDDIQQLYNHPHYNLLTNNTTRHSGGVCLYIRDNIKT